MIVRIDPAIHIHFELDHQLGRRFLIAENLRRGKIVELPTPPAMEALSQATTWISLDKYIGKLIRRGLSKERAMRFVSDALENGLLESFDKSTRMEAELRSRLCVKAKCSLTDKLVTAKEGQPYLDYSESSSDAQEEALMLAYRSVTAPPSSFKDYPGSPFIPLPDKSSESTLGGLDEASLPVVDRPLGLRWLSGLMRGSFGMNGVLTDLIQGDLLLKTHPSGGARHPIECYLAVDRVAGVPEGLYHYSVRRHGLEVLDVRAEVSDIACITFSSIRFPVIALLTVLPERIMWRYRDSASFCVMMLDLGHAVENFSLACRCERLPHRISYDVNGRQLAELLRLPFLREPPLVAVAIGGAIKSR